MLHIDPLLTDLPIAILLGLGDLPPWRFLDWGGRMASADIGFISNEGYRFALGVPALFSRALFPDLLSLTANVGATSLIQEYHDQVYAVPFPEGAIDLDTPANYQLLGVEVCPGVGQIDRAHLTLPKNRGG